MNNKYNIGELKEKINRCKNMVLDDVSLDDIDDIASIKIDKESLATKEF